MVRRLSKTVRCAMTTYEVVEVKWLGNRKWGVKETVYGHPPHICKVCESRREAELLAKRYGGRIDTNMRRAS